MEKDIVIRSAATSDAQELSKIYKPYVTDTAITFEYTAPGADEFAQRIAHTLEKYPYIVALQRGEIVGYAYASEFKSRAAYDWCVETSIYVKQGFHGKGVGKALYAELESRLKQMGILNANACIAYAPTEDEYLTNDSEKFHQKLGYSYVGRFHKCAFKFGRWYDMIWMEKFLGEHAENLSSPTVHVTE